MPSRGQSLVEVLVALAILSVGVLIIVELVIRGLPLLPESRSRAFANVLAQDVTHQLSSGLVIRPDAVCSAVSLEDANGNGTLDPGEDLNGNGFLDYDSGFRLVHNVVMNDVNQFSGEDLNGNGILDPGEDRNGNGILDLLEDRPTFPTLIVGERFRVPQAGVYVVSRGPVAAQYDTSVSPPQPKWPSAKVYDPARLYTRVPSLPPGQEEDGNATTDSLRYAANYGPAVTTFIFDGLNSERFLKVDFSYIPPGGGPIQDIIGYFLTVPAGKIGILPYPAIPYSETIHEIVSGASVEPRTGTISVASVAGGKVLAVDYLVATHRRAGVEGAFFVGDREVRNLEVPDILSYDSIIPVATVSFNGAPAHEVRLPLPFIHHDPLDPLFPEPVRAVDLGNGNLYKVVGENHPLAGDPTVAGVIDFLDGKIFFKDTVTVNSVVVDLKLRPVRIYFRASDGWAVELHAAPAQFALMYFNTDPLVNRLEIDFTSAPVGPKQFWYYLDNPPGSKTRLTFYGELLGGNVVGKPDDDYQRVEVDYITIDAAGQPQRIIAETHLIDHVTHAVFLDHPVILTDADSRDRPLAVRGLSVKARVVWEEDFRRRHADLDVMLPKGEG